MKKTFLLILVNFLLQINFCEAQTISTIAGTSNWGNDYLGISPDIDGLATSINLGDITGICSDRNNNIYFGDRSGRYIRKYTAATRQITTIAGDGTTPIFSGIYINSGTSFGDNLPAINTPTSVLSVVVSNDGNYLYFTEKSIGSRLRMISLLTGTITTVIGDNNQGLLPIGCDNVNFNVLQVKDNLAAKYAALEVNANRNALAIDSIGNLYISDSYGNGRIRKVLINPSTGIVDGNSSITTIAIDDKFGAIQRDGISGYNQSNGVSPYYCGLVDGRGYLKQTSFNRPIFYKSNHLYFMEKSNTEIAFRKINLNTNQISTIINIAPSSIIESRFLVVDAQDNMYVMKSFSSIYKITPAGVVSQFTGTGATATSGPFNSASPDDVTLDYLRNLCINNSGDIIIGEASMLHKIKFCSNSPQAITGATNVCVGNSITLSNATSGGVWSSIAGRATIDASGNVTGISAGTAQIRYTLPTIPPNLDGCSNFSSYIVTVNSIPRVPTITYAPGTPNPQAGAPTGGFCVGKVFTVVGTPNVPAGVWSATGFASITSGGVVSIVGVGTGSIKYTYTNAAGCSNSRTMTGAGYVCAARGVNTVDGQQSTVDGITIYPNPARSFINLNVETLVGKGSIVVTDLYGKAMKTQALSMGTNNVDIANLTKGFYLVSIITSEGKTTKKLVVE